MFCVIVTNICACKIFTSSLNNSMASSTSTNLTSFFYFLVYSSPFVILSIVAIIRKLLHCHNIHFLKTCTFLKKNRRYIFQLMNEDLLSPCYSSWFFYSKLLNKNNKNNKKDIFAYFAKAGQLWNVSVVYISPIAFNVFVQLMIFLFFLPN